MRRAALTHSVRRVSEHSSSLRDLKGIQRPSESETANSPPQKLLSCLQPNQVRIPHHALPVVQSRWSNGWGSPIAREFTLQLMVYIRDAVPKGVVNTS